MADFKTYFTKFQSGGNGFFGFGTGPEADWKVIFVSTLILTAFVGALNIIMFIGIDKGEIFVIDEPAEVENTFDINKLRETSLYYQNKAQEFDKIVRGVRPALVDPSL